MVAIIIKKKPERYRVALPAKHHISKENRTEWRNERRAKMLNQRGYGIGAIHGMMDSGSGQFSASKLEKMVKKERNEKEMRMDNPHL